MIAANFLSDASRVRIHAEGFGSLEGSGNCIKDILAQMRTVR